MTTSYAGNADCTPQTNETLSGSLPSIICLLNIYLFLPFVLYSYPSYELRPFGFPYILFFCFIPPTAFSSQSESLKWFGLFLLFIICALLSSYPPLGLPTLLSFLSLPSVRVPLNSLDITCSYWSPLISFFIRPFSLSHLVASHLLLFLFPCLLPFFKHFHIALPCLSLTSSPLSSPSSPPLTYECSPSTCLFSVILSTFSTMT